MAAVTEDTGDAILHQFGVHIGGVPVVDPPPAEMWVSWDTHPGHVARTDPLTQPRHERDSYKDDGDDDVVDLTLDAAGDGDGDRGGGGDPDGDAARQQKARRLADDVSGGARREAAPIARPKPAPIPTAIPAAAKTVVPAAVARADVKTAAAVAAVDARTKAALVIMRRANAAFGSADSAAGPAAPSVSKPKAPTATKAGVAADVKVRVKAAAAAARRPTAKSEDDGRPDLRPPPPFGDFDSELLTAMPESWPKDVPRPRIYDSSQATDEQFAAMLPKLRRKAKPKAKPGAADADAEDAEYDNEPDTDTVDSTGPSTYRKKAVPKAKPAKSASKDSKKPVAANPYSDPSYRETNDPSAVTHMPTVVRRPMRPTVPLFTQPRHGRDQGDAAEEEEEVIDLTGDADSGVVISISDDESGATAGKPAEAKTGAAVAAAATAAPASARAVKARRIGEPDVSRRQPTVVVSAAATKAEAARPTPIAVTATQVAGPLDPDTIRRLRDTDTLTVVSGYRTNNERINALMLATRQRLRLPYEKLLDSARAWAPYWFDMPLLHDSVRRRVCNLGGIAWLPADQRQWTPTAFIPRTPRRALANWALWDTIYETGIPVSSPVSRLFGRSSESASASSSSGGGEEQHDKSVALAVMRLLYRPRSAEPDTDRVDFGVRTVQERRLLLTRYLDEHAAAYAALPSLPLPPAPLPVTFQPFATLPRRAPPEVSAHRLSGRLWVGLAAFTPWRPATSIFAGNGDAKAPPASASASASASSSSAPVPEIQLRRRTSVYTPLPETAAAEQDARSLAANTLFGLTSTVHDGIEGQTANIRGFPMEALRRWAASIYRPPKGILSDTSADAVRVPSTVLHLRDYDPWTARILCVYYSSFYEAALELLVTIHDIDPIATRQSYRTRRARFMGEYLRLLPMYYLRAADTRQDDAIRAQVAKIIVEIAESLFDTTSVYARRIGRSNFDALKLTTTLHRDRRFIPCTAVSLDRFNAIDAPTPIRPPTKMDAKFLVALAHSSEWFTQLSMYHPDRVLRAVPAYAVRAVDPSNPPPPPPVSPESVSSTDDSLQRVSFGAPTVVAIRPRRIDTTPAPKTKPKPKPELTPMAQAAMASRSAATALREALAHQRAKTAEERAPPMTPQLAPPEAADALRSAHAAAVTASNALRETMSVLATASATAAVLGSIDSPPRIYASGDVMSYLGTDTLAMTDDQVDMHRRFQPNAGHDVLSIGQRMVANQDEQLRRLRDGPATDDDGVSGSGSGSGAGADAWDGDGGGLSRTLSTGAYQAAAAGPLATFSSVHISDVASTQLVTPATSTAPINSLDLDDPVNFYWSSLANAGLGSSSSSSASASASAAAASASASRPWLGDDFTSSWPGTGPAHRHHDDTVPAPPMQWRADQTLFEAVAAWQPPTDPAHWAITTYSLSRSVWSQWVSPWHTKGEGDETKWTRAGIPSIVSLPAHLVTEAFVAAARQEDSRSDAERVALLSVTVPRANCCMAFLYLSVSDMRHRTAMPYRSLLLLWRPGDPASDAALTIGEVKRHLSAPFASRALRDAVRLRLVQPNATSDGWTAVAGLLTPSGSDWVWQRIPLAGPASVLFANHEQHRHRLLPQLMCYARAVDQVVTQQLDLPSPRVILLFNPAWGTDRHRFPGETHKSELCKALADAQCGMSFGVTLIDLRVVDQTVVSHTVEPAATTERRLRQAARRLVAN